MNLKLNPEQQEYLKTLKGKKKKRKFIIDCIIEQVESKRKSVKISELPQVEIPKDKYFILTNFKKPKEQLITRENLKEIGFVDDIEKVVFPINEGIDLQFYYHSAYNDDFITLCINYEELEDSQHVELKEVNTIEKVKVLIRFLGK